MPHVGSHPGLPLFGFLVAVGAAAGLTAARGGDPLLMMLGVALFVGVPMGLVFLKGSVDRARLSDALSARQEAGQVTGQQTHD